jgi:hypothetical protein
MIYTEKFDYDGVLDGLRSFMFWYCVEHATGDPDRSRTYYEKYLYKSDTDPEIVLLPFYRICWFRLQKNFMFGVFQNGNGYEIYDDLLRIPLSYWLVRPNRRWRRWKENPIKLLYRRLVFDSKYGCYSFAGQALFNFAGKLSDIIRFVMFRRGRWREVTRNDFH